MGQAKILRGDHEPMSGNESLRPRECRHQKSRRIGMGLTKRASNVLSRDDGPRPTTGIRSLFFVAKHVADGFLHRLWLTAWHIRASMSIKSDSCSRASLRNMLTRFPISVSSAGRFSKPRGFATAIDKAPDRGNALRWSNSPPRVLPSRGCRGLGSSLGLRSEQCAAAASVCREEDRGRVAHVMMTTCTPA